MKTRYIIIICIAALGLFAGITYIASKNPSSSGTASVSDVDALFKSNKVEDFDAPTQPKIPAGYKQYVHPVSKLSFLHPQDYTVGLFPEGDAEVILVQKEGSEGVQILVSAFDETNTNLTPERIKKEIPDIEMTAEKNINLGSTQGVYFQSTSSSGPTHEFWFIYQSKLYQLSAPLVSGPLVEALVSTIRF